MHFRCRRLEESHFGKQNSPSKNRSPVGRSVDKDSLTQLYSKTNNGKPLSAENFLKEDRERVLELLLSQERVVTLLYAKTFPVGNRTRTPNALAESPLNSGVNSSALLQAGNITPAGTALPQLVPPPNSSGGVDA
jgi:hypothetical protein